MWLLSDVTGIHCYADAHGAHHPHSCWRPFHGRKPVAGFVPCATATKERRRKALILRAVRQFLFSTHAVRAGMNIFVGAMTAP